MNSKRGYILIGLLLIVLVFVPIFLDSYQLQLFIFLFINVILAQSVNLLSGYAGLISIGHAGFFAVGAYASAILMMKLSMPFLLTMVIAILISMFVGWLLSIPAGRVNQFYLTLMTLGFGLIIEVITKEWTLLGGFSGLSNVPSPVLHSLHVLGFVINNVSYYYLTLILLLVISIFNKKIIQSYVGRSLLAIRTNEIAATSVGINAGNVKRMAFMLSAGIAGLGGVLYAHYMSYISHSQFDIFKSISILAMVIIGGMGSLIGPFLGAIFETWLPQLLQSFQEYQLLIYGVLLVGVVRFFPKGLAGLLRIKESYINLSNTKLLGLVNNGKHSEKVNLKKVGNKQEGVPVLDIRNVSKNFGGLVALDDVSLTVNSGEIHGLIGPNGAGKSTLVNVITGVYTINTGNVLYYNQDITQKKLYENARLGIIRIFQDPRIILEASVLENVLLGAQITSTTGGVSKVSGFLKEAQEIEWTNRALEAIHLCGLEKYALQEAGTLPYGLRRLIEVARAIVAQPKLLILDEPAAGLSEKETETLTNLLKKIKADGLAIIIIEHDMDFLLELIDSVTVLDYGGVIYDGDIQGMQKDERVITAYLGVI